MSNVVKMWRRRSRFLGRNALSCTGCGKQSLVARRSCPGCGGVEFEERPLPRHGTAVAITSAGAAVEHLDQVTGKKDAVVLDLGGGTRLPCLLAHSDAALLQRLAGTKLRLVVRRLALGELPTGEPIPYGIKAAVDLETRSQLKSDPDGKEPS